MSKEQQKKHIIDMMEKDEELGLYDEYLKDELKKYKDVKTIVFNKPKQEILLEDIFNDEKRQGVKDLIDKQTLEEASWKHNPLKKLDGEFLRHAFKEGAKWQAEKMYSEEEVLELLIYCKNKFGGSGLEDYTYDDEVKEWFEQFKNK